MACRSKLTSRRDSDMQQRTFAGSSGLRRIGAFSVALLANSVIGCASAPETRVAHLPVSYARDIKPLLEANCYECHGPQLTVPSGKLRLDTRENMLKGGRSGHKAIVPGDGASSPLVIGISGGDYETWRRMPPRGRQLTGGEVALIQRWIDEGASIGVE